MYASLRERLALDDGVVHGMIVRDLDDMRAISTSDYHGYGHGRIVANRVVERFSASYSPSCSGED